MNWAVVNQFFLQGLFVIFGIGFCVSTHYGGGRHVILVTDPKKIAEVNIGYGTRLSGDIYTDQITFAFNTGVPRYRMRLSTLPHCHQNIYPMSLSSHLPPEVVQYCAHRRWSFCYHLGNRHLHRLYLPVYVNQGTMGPYCSGPLYQIRHLLACGQHPQRGDRFRHPGFANAPSLEFTHINEEEVDVDCDIRDRMLVRKLPFLFMWL